MLAVNAAEVEVSSRRSKDVRGDQPRGSRPGRPCWDTVVRRKFTDELTTPGRRETVMEPLTSEPPLGPIGMAGESGVRRASRGKVPTPLCTKISRSTVVVGEIPALVLPGEKILKKRWELFAGIE